jgi:hypothetical protein
MLRRSVFDYGAGTWEAELSAVDWLPMDSTVGGQRISAAGIPASYVVRRDVLLQLTLRVRESEWASFLNLLTYGQAAEAITWTPDAEVPAETYQVYWHAPAAGEQMTPSRNAEYPSVFEVSITLRGVGTSAPWRPYYGAT